VRDILLADLNPELMLAYRTIQREVESLIDQLAEMQNDYLALDVAQRKQFFYETRTAFNRQLHVIDFDAFNPTWVKRCAQIIFLNRTCYNGLFRVNAKGEFNVPAGRYKTPAICDAANLRAVSRVLQGAALHLGDFTDIEEFVDRDTFVYLDPPYRPISRTAHFRSYSVHDFDDAEQLRLAAFYRRLDGAGAKLMLSNSDPQNECPDDDFFDDAYAGFRIERVEATRNINRNAHGRGAIRELLICNWPAEA
jgi:DNA adenine methylase